MSARGHNYKILLVMPLSTADWGCSNAGGVDSVCQMMAEYISRNCNPCFSYRILAIEQLENPKAYGKVINLGENVELIWIPRRKKIANKLTLPSIIYYLLKVRQHAKDYAPDIIHTHLWSALLGCSRSLPSIVTVHSYKEVGRTSVSLLNDCLYVKFVPYLNKFFGTKIVCVGKELARVVSLDVNQEVITIPNPIDSEYFKLGVRANNNGTMNFVTCSLINRKKQVEKSILLISELIAAGNKCYLNIIGPATDIEYLEELKSLIDEKNIADSVFFLGRMNKCEILEQYRSSDIGLFFSREETFGLVPLEMLASGLPVLATKVGVLAEEEDFFCSNGVTFVEDEQTECVDSLMYKALNNKKTVDQEALKKRYEVGCVVKQYEELYMELVS